MHSRTFIDWFAAVVFLLALMAVSAPLWAQSAGSASYSGASSTSSSSSASQGGTGIGIGIGGNAQAGLGVRDSFQTTQTFEGTDLSESVPNTFPSRLTSSYSGSCIGSWSAGGSVAGFGLSGGKTVIDEACVRRENASALSALGLTDIAMEVLCGGDDVFDAAARNAKRLGRPSVCAGIDPSSKEYDSSAVATYGKASAANEQIIATPLEVKVPTPEQVVKVHNNGNGNGYGHSNPFYRD